ncbi:glycoside hydrolase superfamily [Tribonema minus]|uniref:Glycoside hydrolase superfamily n=1 Tax=Tribonema minus TaxID=303371 RepID=A0A836CET3_9STRA|nr:glycoside hydrolase superfamily [Tribonema minus]
MRFYASAFCGTDAAIFDFERQRRIVFNAVQVYRPINSVGFNYIATRGKQLQIVTEFPGTLSDILDGKFDDDVRRLGRDIKAGGEEVWIRQLHEFNYAGTYPWCIDLSPASIALFKRAWRRIVSLYREVGAPVRFQWCLQAKNPGKVQVPYSQLYPGDDAVDAVGVDLYINPGSKLVSLKQRLQDGVYSQLAAFGKPVFIGETSCTDEGLDKAGWMREAWRDLASPSFDSITTVNFFLVDKDPRRWWGLNTAAEVKGFVAGYREYAEARGIAQAPAS